MIPSTAPTAHQSFVRRAIERLAADARFVGLAAAGSWAENTMDEFSDLDLVLAIETACADEVMAQRHAIAQSLGDLLVSFTGEHVGEPRLIIGLYDHPLLHVDLKFVPLEEAGKRVDDPVVLWERDGRLSLVLGQGRGVFPAPDQPWIEDRFWVWVHAAAARVARGELFDAIEFLSFLRVNVLGPLSLQQAGRKPMGTRRVETALPAFTSELVGTLSGHDAQGCFAAIERCAELYRRMRSDNVKRHERAEAAAMNYLARVRMHQPLVSA
jgi:hypothetical protein